MHQEPANQWMVGGGVARDSIQLRIGPRPGMGPLFDGIALRDYMINEQFRRINGVLYVLRPSNQNQSSAAFGNLVILGDGIELYRSPNMSVGSSSVEFDVDISGVTTLRIMFEYRNVIPSSGIIVYGISNTELIR